MGDFRVRKIFDSSDRHGMYQAILKDIEAFEIMLRENYFETGPPMIGAEQELCIVDQNFEPATSALELLKKINDPHYTNELALFNLEINLDPKPLKERCFSDVENELIALLSKGYEEARKENSFILQSGILPTLKYRHLQFEHMTPIERYKTLSNSLFELRGEKFEVHLQGVDELIMSLGSVLFEACNTSFQLHLQIHPDEFVDKHNWSQMISGPVLSACVNSPILFGNELWAETRIALFKQSLDTRSSKKYLRKKEPRVYFGDSWLKGSPAELWKRDTQRFPLLLTSDDLKDSISELKNKVVPELRGIQLHNGTTYTWNRMCYGHSTKKPHLRIECRYLPAGPSVIDEIANFAFWIGLMNSEPPGGNTFWEKTDFRMAKRNFINSARTGLNTVFNWFGEQVSAKKLILDILLPMAENGLTKCGVEDADIKKYLSVLEKRVRNVATGADWTVKNYRKLADRYGKVKAEKELVRLMYQYQRSNTPVHEWENITDFKILTLKTESTVEQIMTENLYSVHEDDSIELAKSILNWNNIHHLPVENQMGDLVGMITDGLLKRFDENGEKDLFRAKDIMLQNPVTIQAHDSLVKANSTLKENNLSGLPVVLNQKLVGIITIRDINKMTGNMEN